MSNLSPISNWPLTFHIPLVDGLSMAQDFFRPRVIIESYYRFNHENIEFIFAKNLYKSENPARRNSKNSSGFWGRPKGIGYEDQGFTYWQ